MEQQQRIEIGQRIRALREASPQTNASIAEAVGVGERAVANWVSGGTGITYRNAAKVAELFGVSLTWLWTGEEKSEPAGPAPDPFAVSERAEAKTLDDLSGEVAALRSELLTEMAILTEAVEALRKQRPHVGRKASGGASR
jgi:transcriptional regulator with XRE-family HTH domain